MGVEYQLRFDTPDPEEAAAIVGQFPGASGLASPGAFELRALGSAGNVPDAMVRVEPCGAYYCWYGAAGRELLGTLVARLVSRFGAVTVEDWE